MEAITAFSNLTLKQETLSKGFGKEGRGAGEFNFPYGVCMHDSGKIVVTDTCNNRVQVLNEDGEHLLTFGDNGELDRPVQCIYWRNAYIVSSLTNHILNIFDCGGTLLYEGGE